MAAADNKSGEFHFPILQGVLPIKGSQIPAEVIAIVPTADRQKATVRVRIGFLERDERVLRDMGAKVAFLGSEAPTETQEELTGVLVARDAVREDADGAYVWRVSGGVVERRTV